MKQLLYVFLFLIGLCGLSGCVPAKVEQPAPAPVCTTEVEEIPLCTEISYSPANSVELTGTATFQKRTIVENASYLNLSQGLINGLPIKYAEVHVLDGNGNRVQCGSTNQLGEFKAIDGSSALRIPAASGNYTVQVLSRTNKKLSPTGGEFHILTSVKKDICSNSLHTVAKSFTSTGSNTGPIHLVATADETVDAQVPGGAFNILNDLITTYEYLADTVGASENLSCLNPKLHMYWQSGFNPAQYLYPDSDPQDVPNVSFYMRGRNELYINGGKLGDVKRSDTDHFDDAVVIHEIGHHIESACSNSDSPGGSHSGLFRIDPRLAWSEGWGNFLGAHIIKNNFDNIYLNDPGVLAAVNAVAVDSNQGWNFYLDTEGYYPHTFGVNGQNIRFELVRSGDNPEMTYFSPFLGLNYYYDKVDGTTSPGEGHFREVSIARSLFKTSNSCLPTGRCTDQSNYFLQIWQSFRELGLTNYPFRSSTRFYHRLYNKFTANDTVPANWPTTVDTILQNEAQQRHGSNAYLNAGNVTWPSYGVKLVSNGTTPCSIEFQPRNEPATTYIYGLDDDVTDARFSNHFYHLDLGTLSPLTSITLTATKTGSFDVDLDMVLMNEGYRYPEDPCLSYNNNYFCTNYRKATASTTNQFVRESRRNSKADLQEEEILNLNSLSTSSRYILNIRAFTAGTDIVPADNATYTYTLTTNTGDYLCPDTNY